MAAGSIVVDLLMKTGTFETDTARASKALKQFKKDADEAGKAIGAAFVAGGLGLGYLVKSTIDAEDHLNDLSKKTGIAADTLGGIGFAAQQSGGDLDSAAAAAGKLNKSLAEAAAGNAQAAEAFKVLGINVKDATGATKSADTVLAEIADKFAGYADGPEKAALALRIFGKAGADIIPLLDDGGRALQDNIAYYKRYSGVTQETAQASDQFNDTLTKIKLLSGAFGKTLTAELLGPLQALADLWLKNKENGDQFHGVATTIVEVIKGTAIAVAYGAESFYGYARSIAIVAVVAERLAHFDLSSARAAIQAFTEDNIAARKRIDDLTNALSGNASKGGGIDFGKGASDFEDSKKKAAPRLPATATGPADDPTKKLLENQLKEFQKDFDQERDLFQTRNEFIEFYNSQNLLSLKDYYDARQVTLDEATRGEIAAIDKQIAALEANKANPKTSKIDQASDEGKLIDLREKRAKIEEDADKQAILLGLQRGVSTEALVKQFQAVNAQVLDLTENFSAAAAIKFDLQFDALSKTFTANGNKAGLDAISTLRSAAIAQAAFQKASLDAGRTFDSLARQEDYLNLAQQSGSATTIATLIKVGEARKAQIPLLEAQVQAEEAIAKASGNPALIINAEQARLALEKLKATVDPLGDEFRKNFTDSATDSLYDFATGAKSASDAFDSFAKSVLNNILKLGSQSIAETIFGKNGLAGDAPGILSKLLGSGSGPDVSSPGAASDVGNGLSTSVGAFASIAKFFSGFFADGGTIPAGKWGVVGERGPEPAFGGSTGLTVHPAGGKSTVNHINVSVPIQPGQSRDTAMQQGAAIGLGIQRAMARNS